MLVLGCALITTSPAHAYETFNDHRLKYGVVDQSYWIDTSAIPHAAGIDVGMSRWDSTATPIAYARTTAKATSRMDFYKVSSINIWWAMTEHYVNTTKLPSPPTTNWWWVKVLLDADFVDCPNKIGAIAHEVGHGMGLAHTRAYSLMNDDDIYSGTNVPTADDVAGINHLY